MKTLVIVKSFSGRYYIYNAYGKCVATCRAKDSVYSYLETVLTTFEFSTYLIKATASKDTFIVNLM